MATDASGNVYMAGVFTGTVGLGSFTVTSYGPMADDIFIAKWHPATGFVWVKQARGSGNEGISDLKVSGGNVYVMGYSASPALVMDNTTLASSGGGQSTRFLLKLNDAGSVAWAELIGAGSGLEVVGNNLYLSGGFQGTLNWGSTTLTAAGTSSDVFIAKMVDSGSSVAYSWALKAGGSASDGGGGIAVVGTSVYITGLFGSSTATFGSSALNNAGSTGKFDVFVAKVIDNGPSAAFAWAQRAGGTDDEYVSDIVASNGSLYLTGLFTGTTTTFGATQLQKVPALPGVTRIVCDAFVAKLSENGANATFDWAYGMGGPEDDEPWGLVALNNQVYVAGNFGTSIEIGTTSLAGAGAKDMFVAKWQDNGSTASAAWAKQGGGTGIDELFSFASTGGVLYLGGSISAPASFDSHTIPSAGCCSYPQAFWASLAENALSTSARQERRAVELFPNPARTTVTLRLDSDAPRQDLHLTLLDATGRTVLAKPLPPTGAALPVELGPQPAGLYLVRVAGPTGYLATQRLVVE